jgi:XRE family transcriptional regulator, regulator of sulfur utilization
MEPINDQIAWNIKRLRKEKELTLDELAVASDVSKSMLSEIERGGTNPTILVLWKIAEGLHVPLTMLISQPSQDFSLIRRNDYKTVNETTELRISSLLPFDNAHQSEIFEIEIHPNSTLANKGHQNGIDEVILVMEGSVDFISNNELFTLEKGDLVRFNGDLPHTFHNVGVVPVVMLNILYYKKSPE